MQDDSDILISVKPRYAEEIFGGKKTVELRKRRLSIKAGVRIWIYATAPVSALQGYASLDELITDTPCNIWSKLGKNTSLSRGEFDTYFEGCEIAHALILSDVHKLNSPLALNEMKKMVEGFHPPQFFCRLNGAVSAMRLTRRATHKAGTM